LKRLYHLSSANLATQIGMFSLVFIVIDVNNLEFVTEAKFTKFHEFRYVNEDRFEWIADVVARSASEELRSLLVDNFEMH